MQYHLAYRLFQLHPRGFREIDHKASIIVQVTKHIFQMRVLSKLTTKIIFIHVIKI